MSSLEPLSPGTRLNEYRIEAVLGQGGFGITYRAVDTHLEKQVAVKEFAPAEFAMRCTDDSVAPVSPDEEETYRWGLDRFLDEAKALGQFDHPNLNRVNRYFEANGTAYLVLEYLEGQPLSEVLQAEGALPPERVQNLLVEMASALDEVHRAGYIHRDIKPSNILVTSNWRSVLIDFGAAREAVGERSAMLTQLLTPGYAPVEQYDTKGADIGPWTDLYALGMVAYRCVTGARENNLPEATARYRGRPEGRLIPAREAAKGQYPDSLLKAIDWATQPEEKERPQNAREFLEAVKRSGGGARAEPARGPSRRTWIAAAAVVVLVALGAALGAFQPAYLSIEPSVDGARVHIDGEELGDAPVSRVARSGTYEVRIRKPGYATWEKEVDVGLLEFRTLEPELSSDLTVGSSSELREALGQAVAGATITLEPGEYEGPFDISGDVTLKGAGTRDEVEVTHSGDRDTLRVTGGTPTLRGLAIRYTGTGGEQALEIRADARPTVQEVLLTTRHDESAPVVWVTDEARPVFEDVLIMGEGSEVASNGMLWGKSARGTISESTIERFGKTALVVKDAAQPTVKSNTFRNLPGGGVLVTGEAKGEFIDNSFERNVGSPAVWVGGQASPTVRGNIFSNIEGSVLSVNGTAAGHYTSNQIVSAGTDRFPCVAIGAATSATVESNRIADCRGEPFAVQAGSETVMRDNEIN